LSRSIPTIYHPLGLTVVMLTLVVARQLGVPLAETAVILYSLLRVFSVIGPLAEEKHVIDALFANYERILEFRRAAEQARQPSGSRPFARLTHEIAFERVSFAHAGRPPVLVDVSVRIPKGAFVAFVGESGAGKSTLVDLLVGLHVPDAGRITIDGVGLPAFDVASYRRRIGYVPQDSVLFNASIRDNIMWAREDATDQDVANACRLANALEFIERLPDGYATIVGDRGVRLSGGQVQRIALARAILRNPDILILDEATSSLDALSERLIQQAIEQIAHKTTVIAIAHRLSTVANADHIYVLSGGRIIEHGSYAALMAEDGVFSRMVGVQALDARR
jgi:ABC-type multidrug transport system fused ATPase/permease subunit